MQTDICELGNTYHTLASVILSPKAHCIARMKIVLFVLTFSPCIMWEREKEGNLSPTPFSPFRICWVMYGAIFCVEVLNIRTLTPHKSCDPCWIHANCRFARNDEQQQQQQQTPKKREHSSQCVLHTHTLFYFIFISLVNIEFNMIYGWVRFNFGNLFNLFRIVPFCCQLVASTRIYGVENTNWMASILKKIRKCVHS